MSLDPRVTTFRTLSSGSDFQIKETSFASRHHTWQPSGPLDGLLPERYRRPSRVETVQPPRTEKSVVRQISLPVAGSRSVVIPMAAGLPSRSGLRPKKHEYARRSPTRHRPLSSPPEPTSWKSRSHTVLPDSRSYARTIGCCSAGKLRWL